LFSSGLNSPTAVGREKDHHSVRKFPGFARLGTDSIENTASTVSMLLLADSLPRERYVVVAVA
jgi:hypothetical protein